MTTASLAPYLVQRFQDNNNNPLVGGLLYSYMAGTNTPQVTYTDTTAATPNTNPIVMNARGECGVYIKPNVSYKFSLTDSLGNVIWTVDNIVNTALTTLYGGTDLGIASAYVLSFTAPFTSYTDGSIVYFLASNTNNSAANTININGLGVIPLVNVDGSVINVGQIQGGQVASIMILGGKALLLSSGDYAPYIRGTVLLTFAGFVGTVTTTASYDIVGGVVTLSVPVVTGTSNSTSFTFATPGNSPLVGDSTWFSVPAAQDAGGNIFAQVGSTVQAMGGVQTFTLYKNGVSTGWTASGLKSLGISGLGSRLTIVYRIA